MTKKKIRAEAVKRLEEIVEKPPLIKSAIEVVNDGKAHVNQLYCLAHNYFYFCFVFSMVLRLIFKNTMQGTG